MRKLSKDFFHNFHHRIQNPKISGFVYYAEGNNYAKYYCYLSFISQLTKNNKNEDTGFLGF